MKKLSLFVLLFVSGLGTHLFSNIKGEKVKITGELKLWHKVTLNIQGPQVSENDIENPFLNYRLHAVFTHKDTSLIVPGFFAADGNAAETSATKGNIWRINFCAVKTGEWSYTISFKKGDNIVVTDDQSIGTSVDPDGATGSFKIQNPVNTGSDFRGKGRLIVTKKGYLKHAGSGEYFLKGGADSPENFLAYKGFDQTYSYTGKAKIKTYSIHEKDWHNGDPIWQGTKGKGIIGALNYLSSQGVNSVYMLTMNVMGDGDDVWPWTNRNERYRFDCSKLDQWEKVFCHMDSLGMMLHIVTQETENECLLDGGWTEVQRSLYYRELIARFSHHLGVTWNMGEENGARFWTPVGQSIKQKRQMCSYIKNHDPYKNLVVIHTHSTDEGQEQHIPALVGFKDLDGISLQSRSATLVRPQLSRWMQASIDSSHRWIVSSDEIGHHSLGVVNDTRDPMHDSIRHKVLWGSLMAGSAGVEWYFGKEDLTCENFTSRHNMWKHTKIARDFFLQYLPFYEMSQSDELLYSKKGFCFAKKDQVYAIYLPNGGDALLDLGHAKGSYSVMWYNPRSGGQLLKAKIKKVSAGNTVFLGQPPLESNMDWVILVRKVEY